MPPGYGNALLEVRAIDANTARITGGQGYSAYTTDGGATWTRDVVEPGWLYSFECAYFFDLHDGWVGGPTCAGGPRPRSAGSRKPTILDSARAQPTDRGTRGEPSSHSSASRSHPPASAAAA